ncbi:MAG: hypothetical protein JXA68_04090 [Ignavibacteriales bacterium]|nr:hypothetical protein [Ignavibacteriales bacterium]
MSQRNVSTGRIVVAAILIVLGSLFLLDNYNVFNINIPDYIFKWQYILIFIGLIILAVGNNKMTGIILILVGVIGYWHSLWPLILVVIGLYILLRNKEHFGRHHRIEGNVGEAPRKEANLSSDYLDEFVMFGGGEKIVESNNFKGGKVTAIFGGYEIDLRDCELAEGENILDIFAMFGGVDLFVPKDWKVVLKTTPIFGGFGDERRKDPNVVYPENKVLILKGTFLFGGGEIKN